VKTYFPLFAWPRESSSAAALIPMPSCRHRCLLHFRQQTATSGFLVPHREQRHPGLERGRFGPGLAEVADEFGLSIVFCAIASCHRIGESAI
jgi:hypothetical protein